MSPLLKLLRCCGPERHVKRCSDMTAAAYNLASRCIIVAFRCQLICMPASPLQRSLLRPRLCTYALSQCTSSTYVLLELRSLSRLVKLATAGYPRVLCAVCGNPELARCRSSQNIFYICHVCVHRMYARDECLETAARGCVQKLMKLASP